MGVQKLKIKTRHCTGCSFHIPASWSRKFFNLKFQNFWTSIMNECLIRFVKFYRQLTLTVLYCNLVNDKDQDTKVSNTNDPLSLSLSLMCINACLSHIIRPECLRQNHEKGSFCLTLILISRLTLLCILRSPNVLYSIFKQVLVKDMKQILLTNMKDLLNQGMKVQAIHAWGWFICLLGSYAMKNRQLTNEMLKIPENTFSDLNPQVQIASQVFLIQLDFLETQSLSPITDNIIQENNSLFVEFITNKIAPQKQKVPSSISLVQ